MGGGGAAGNAGAGYYKLIGEKFEYVGTAVHTVLGRAHASPPSSFFSLGVSKTVSRHHVSLTYSPTTRRWLCVVVGKNAVQVDGQAYKRTTTAATGQEGEGVGGDGGGEEGPELRVELPTDRPVPLKVGEVKFWFCPAKPH